MFYISSIFLSIIFVATISADNAVTNNQEIRSLPDPSSSARLLTTSPALATPQHVGLSNCKEDTSTCTEIKKCAPFMQILRQNNKSPSASNYQKVREAFCGVDESTGSAKVCCPNKALQPQPTPSPQQPKPSKPVSDSSVVVSSEQQRQKIESHKNLKLLPSLSKCGVSIHSDRIVGGKNASLGAYPWLVLLGFTDPDGDIQWACGGSLINERTALTAAHCTSHLPKGFKVSWVRIGEHNQGTDIDCDESGLCAPKVQEIAVDRIVNHPMYNKGGGTENDIALVIFKSPCQFNSFVQPVCLPQGSVVKSIPSNSVFKVAGWGRTDFQKEDGSDILQELTVPVVSKAKCEESYRKQTKNSTNKITSIDETRFCAGGDPGKDSCRGDSGGPLLSSVPVPEERNKKLTFQWGVVSLGPAACGHVNEPALYTKVVTFVPWILDNLSAEENSPVPLPNPKPNVTATVPSSKPFDCVNPQGKFGYCIELQSCESLFNILKERNYDNDFIVNLQRSTCDWTSKNEPKVCCVSNSVPKPHPPGVPATTDSHNHADNPIPSKPENLTNVTPVEGMETSPVVASKNILQQIVSHPNLPLLPTPKTCGNSFASDRIVGGQDAGLGTYPWMALLGFEEGPGKVQFACGGSLINAKYILTAAHCTAKSKLPKGFNLKMIRIGEYDKSQNPDCEGELCAPEVQDIVIEEVITHENYDKESKKENDISLIRLIRPVRMGPFVQPICLPITEYLESVPNSITYKVAGWGRTDFRLPANADVLQEVSVPLISLNECEEYYRNITKGKMSKLESTRFCAGGEVGKDSCKGDSGGPLMSNLPSKDIRSGRRSFQFGVVSLGPSACGASNQPALYTKVTENLPWILQNLKP